MTNRLRTIVEEVPSPGAFSMGALMNQSRSPILYRIVLLMFQNKRVCSRLLHDVIAAGMQEHLKKPSLSCLMMIIRHC